MTKWHFGYIPNSISHRSVLILIVLQEKFFQIIFPLLPFWMPWKRVADVQTTLRVHLYCPSMPFYPWENTGEHILKSFAELLILYCICGWLFIYWIIWWIIKPLLYPGSIFWPVFFILAGNAHSIIWIIGRKSNYCWCGAQYKSWRNI